MRNLEEQLLKLVRLHQPVKARDLTKILADEFAKPVNRTDINSVLYRFKKENLAKVDDSYQWSLTDHSAAPVSRPLVKPIPTEPTATAPEITFTPEQDAVINLDPNNHLLIRGQAGSGKTTVLAARANKILSATSKGSLLFLTYNAALSTYVKNIFKEAGAQKEVAVKTFHEWSQLCAKELGADTAGWVDTKIRSQILKGKIKQAELKIGKHRLFEIDKEPSLLTWWGEEFAWLYGQHILELNDYLNAERTNRGTSIRVSQEDRRFVWFVFELYQEWLSSTKQQDYDNPAGLLLEKIKENNGVFPESLRYDHVMVDEVQDFDKSWLLAVAKTPRVSLSLAGDLAQKIYRRSFTWRSVGIQVQGGRSRKLSASHRTTQQIMSVAEYLLKNNDISSNEDYTHPSNPIKKGAKVRRLNANTPKEAYEQGYKFIAGNFKRLRTATVAVVLPFTRQMYPAQTALAELGVEAKAVKGSSLGRLSSGIAITTFHQLKGLEFDHVVIMGLHDSQYPGRVLENIAEEDRADQINLMRRIVYMAMTRAKQSVTLVGSTPFCRFFDEVPDELFDEVEH